MNLKATFTPRFRSPAIFRAFPELVVAESTRHGGVSLPPYHTLNLGRSTQDKPEHVAINRQLFWEAIGITKEQVASSHQVHGNEVLVTETAGDYEGYDALITQQKAIYLAVTVADCTPIVIYDPVNKVVAAIHAGWRGTVSSIVVNAVQKMQATFGTNPSDCHAYIGTCIDRASFEVGEEVARHFAEHLKDFDEGKQKFLVDLKVANHDQLVSCGVPSGQIQISAYSTVTDNRDYFSYRKENGTTGRMLLVIGMKNS